MKNEKMRAQMDALGYRIEKLAEKSGVSVSTVKRALAGKPISETSASLLAAILCMDPDAFTKSKDNSPIDPGDIGMRGNSRNLDQVYHDRVTDLLNQIYDLRKFRRVLILIIIFLVLFICGILAFDIMNPRIGWVRY